jgi:uncharacterized UBP type Zn finger protein
MAGLCQKQDHDKCVAQFGTGPELDWTCRNCPKKKEKNLHPYTNKLLNNRMMRLGGYPFKANDFTPEEWIDLGRIEACLATPARSK